VTSGISGRRPEESDASTPAVADGDLVAFDDDRDPPASAGEFQHFFEEGCVADDITVEHFEAFGGVGLTGRRGVGSGILAEDANHAAHRDTSMMPMRPEEANPVAEGKEW